MAAVPNQSFNCKCENGMLGDGAGAFARVNSFGSWKLSDVELSLAVGIGVGGGDHDPSLWSELNLKNPAQVRIK